MILIGFLVIVTSVTLNVRGNELPEFAKTFPGQKTPGTTPVRFAEDIIGDIFYPHSKLILSPDGKECIGQHSLRHILLAPLN
jgi:hypothetical protein